MQTPTSRSTNRRRWARFLGAGTTALVVAAVATAAGAATTPNAPSGASGSVAALSGSTMEVQSASSGQTTVSWTPTTQFSKTVTEAVSSLAAGDCISVTGTASKSSKTTIAARTINVTPPSSTGSCTGFGARAAGAGAGAGASGGFQFRGGGGAGFGGGTRPSFAGGGGAGASNFRKAFASLSVASGKVTAVSGSTVTLSGITVSPGSFVRGNAKESKNSAKSRKLPTPKTQALKITTSGSTTLSSTQTAAASDLAVGDCVSAFGPAATNGAVTATTVRITSTGGGTCTGGFAGFGGGGGAFFGGGGPGGPGGAGGSGA
jgi:hypothetical protein